MVKTAYVGQRDDSSGGGVPEAAHWGAISCKGRPGGPTMMRLLVGG
jgi:hypothetical protein